MSAAFASLENALVEGLAQTFNQNAVPVHEALRTKVDDLKLAVYDKLEERLNRTIAKLHEEQGKDQPNTATVKHYEEQITKLQAAQNKQLS